jgi:hypothetical protein
MKVLGGAVNGWDLNCRCWNGSEGGGAYQSSPSTQMGSFPHFSK